MIKAIAFDHDGVIKFREGDVFAEICNYLEVNREDWEREYFLVNHLINTNKKSVLEVISSVVFKFTNSKEKNDYILKLIKNYKNTYHLNYELIDIIKTLKNKGYKLAVVSNNSIKLKQRLEEDNIINLFDQIIISAEVGYQKPDPIIFDILFKKLEVEPNEVIFIDDTLRCLEGADKIGYIPILFNDNKTFKEELSNLLEIEI
jgi:epoxide hydrolase-like predicted phosphatase